MNLEEIYKASGALLEGHFLLSSGKHSPFYLQSAKVLEQPAQAEELAQALARQMAASGVEFDTVCSPALGGLLAGYELARAMKKRFIFVERVQGEMTLRRGFEVKEGERFIVCEDIITTGGSALEAHRVIESLGGQVLGYAALANRGICQRQGSDTPSLPECRIPENLPFFALDDFTFDIYEPDDCPLCSQGSQPIKPGSRGN